MIKDCFGNIRWMSTVGGAYRFALEWRLFAGDWIALSDEVTLGDGIDKPPKVEWDERPKPPTIDLSSRPGTLVNQIKDLSISSENQIQRPRYPVYLFLDPSTSQLILHSSRHPDQVSPDKIIFITPHHRRVPSDPEKKSFTVLQGDGNLVIYAGDNGAIWSSGTNGFEEEGERVEWLEVGKEGMLLRGENGKSRWRSW